MGAAMFYQLGVRPLEAALPALVKKALSAGWRVAIRGTDRTRLDRLDRVLWHGEGFLPHGIAGGPHDADQPVLLTMDEATNGARCLMAVDGAEVKAGDAAGMERVCVIFDGSDPVTLETARRQWREMTEAGVPAQYWAEEDGRWVKKAESKA